MVASRCVLDRVLRLDFLATLVVLFVWNLSLHPVTGECTRHECSEKEGEYTKNVCQSKAKEILEAEKTENRTLVCLSVHELYVCVGEHIPQCLGLISESFEHYTHPPWECQYTDNQVETFQNLYSRGCVDIKNVSATETYRIVDAETKTESPQTRSNSDQSKPGDGVSKSDTVTEHYREGSDDDSSEMSQDSPKSEHTRTGDAVNDTSSNDSKNTCVSPYLLSMMLVASAAFLR